MTRPPLALTMGDPAGIGPDCTLLAWLKREEFALPPFLVAGDPELFSARARALGLDAPIVEVAGPEDLGDCFARAVPVYPILLSQPVTPGIPDKTSAPAIIESIEVAFGWTRDRRTGGLVTNPINKKLLSETGFNHPGHTEFLARLSARDDDVPRPVMLLTGGDLRVVPVTVHMPLKDVPMALNEPLIVETVEIAVRAMRDDFQIPEPRIGVTGLNPHAGENGALGEEEVQVIIPAIATLNARGINVDGPLSADAAFQERMRAQYDLFVAMYHDQALIPVKTLAFDKTVNATLGLPIIRTSPDHGTAYGLAGTGEAHPGSLIEALRLADELASRQLATT